VANKVKVFLNTSDTQYAGGYECIRATSGTGFVSYVTANMDNDENKVVASHLDAYLYGWPSDDDCSFQYGIYSIAGQNFEKVIETIEGEEPRYIIERGSYAKNDKQAIAKNRLATSVIIPFGDYQIKVAIGDSPIVETCGMLAQETGIGMLVRYDLRKNKTFISIRIALHMADVNGIKAGELAHAIIGGGGSESMG